MPGDRFMLHMLSFDCQYHGQYMLISSEDSKKNVLSLSFSPSKMTSGNADLIFFYHCGRSQRLSIFPKMPHLSVFEINESPRGDGIKMS